MPPVKSKVSGAWVFQGTRVPVHSLFENLEDGATVDDFLAWFPGVRREPIKAVLEFAEEKYDKGVEYDKGDGSRFCITTIA